MEYLGKFFFIVIAMVISSIIGAFVLLKLWMWFVFPVFIVPALTIWQAMGISFFIGYLKIDLTKNSDDNDDSLTDRIAHILITVIVYAALVLGLGWILSCII